jgi:hypothetical protein
VTPDTTLNTPAAAFRAVLASDCLFTTGTVATGIRSHSCTYSYETSAPTHTTHGKYGRFKIDLRTIAIPAGSFTIRLFKVRVDLPFASGTTPQITELEFNAYTYYFITHNFPVSDYAPVATTIQFSYIPYELLRVNVFDLNW